MAQYVIESGNDQAVVTVTNDGSLHDPDEGFPRVQYMYVITTDDFEYVGNDVHGPSGGDADVNKAGQSVLAWLHDEGDAYLGSLRDSDGFDWEGQFPKHVAEWAAANQIALGIEAIRCERLSEESPEPFDTLGEPEDDEDAPF
jgi:hypothetical protein